MQSKSRRSPGFLSLSAAAAMALLLWCSHPAVAEFEIQESTVEKGQVEIEYRGALHWGLPEPEDEPLRQSHELETQIGVTDFWLLSVIAGWDQPLGEDLQLTSVEVESQFELIELKGDGRPCFLQ